MRLKFTPGFSSLEISEQVNAVNRLVELRVINFGSNGPWNSLLGQFSQMPPQIKEGIEAEIRVLPNSVQDGMVHRRDPLRGADASLGTGGLYNAG